MKMKIPYKAPNFSLQGTDGALHSLHDFRGKWVVLYFYPQDDTPGCTAEACGFRDNNDALLAKAAVVVGVSRDAGESHQRFVQKYNLNFLLLSDSDHAVMDMYGAWGSKMFGNVGVLRKTFLINPAGDVVKVYGRVTPIGHASQVLNDLAKLQQQSN